MIRKNYQLKILFLKISKIQKKVNNLERIGKAEEKLIQIKCSIKDMKNI